MNHLIMRIPTELRDGDGVRLDTMLQEQGATVIRELPRKYADHVDLLVEDTSAPEEIRGLVVVPIFEEVPDPSGGPDPVLSFDRWAEWEPPAVPS